MFRTLLTAMPLLAAVLGQPVEQRATPSDFQLYAYGTTASGINGLPVIYMGGLAYISGQAPAAINGTAQNVTFAASGTRGNLTATTPDAGSSLLYVPTTSGAVGFTNTTDDTKLTGDFGFYGQLLFAEIDSQIVTEFYASPTTDSNLWSLTWDVSEDTDIPVAIRNVAPSTADTK